MNCVNPELVVLLQEINQKSSH